MAVVQNSSDVPAMEKVAIEVANDCKGVVLFLKVTQKTSNVYKLMFLILISYAP